MKRLTLIDKAFFLKQSPLFSSLDLDLLLTIADKLGMTIFEENTPIFKVNEEANRMYFILKGQVEVFSSNDQSICILREGAFFGEESLFNDKPRAYQVISQTETMLLTLSRTNLYAIISECPSVAVGFLQVYTASNQFREAK